MDDIWDTLSNGYDIHTIDNGSQIKPAVMADLADMCARASAENTPAGENMSLIDWRNRPETLFNALLIQRRFDHPKGRFHYLTYQDRIIACSGVTTADHDPDVGLIGVRGWTDPSVRSQYVQARFLLAKQLEWVKSLKTVAWMTFNEYNKDIVKLLLRAGSGKATRFGMRVPDFYREFKLYPNHLMIRDVPQIVLYRTVTNDVFADDSWQTKARQIEAGPVGDI